MTEPKTHLVVGTPCFNGQVASLYTTSLLKLQQACAQRGNLDLSINLLWGDALITRARQDIVAHFLENQSATHLLFVDADMGFEPDQVFRLLDFGADVAAAVYPTKRYDWDKIAEHAKAGRIPLESSALSYVMEVEDDPQKQQVRGRFAKAKYAGAGFMMIKRQALAAMVERYQDLRFSKEHQANDPLKDSRWRCALFNCLIDEATGAYLSEDYSFCRRWREMGGEIWVDLESQLFHIGTVAFRGIFTTQYNRPAP
jgi:hypothetical protein